MMPSDGELANPSDIEEFKKDANDVVVEEEERETMELGESEIEEEEEAAADANHSPLDPNLREEVTVGAQSHGVETLGDNVNAAILEPISCLEGAIAVQTDGLGENIIVSILNNDDDGGGADDGSENDLDEILYSDDEDPEEEMDIQENNEDYNEHEEDPLMVTDNVISDKKTGQKLEVFVSKLDDTVGEEDLIQVFGKFGEIKSARVVRNKTSDKSKGFAFIQYASYEQAESAISASEGGIEVRGKQVKVSASNDNNTTLYVGNICRLWTKEHVLETLKKFGIENVEDVRLPGSQKDGRTRGFAFLEFDTHLNAMSAFQRLSKSDAIFGRDENARVSFCQTSLHPREEDIPQVKTIFVEGLTDVWTEEKLKEFCENYGKVEEIRLSRTNGKRRKDYGHIDFATHESALACVEEFNKASIEVKASIAKPLLKGRAQKQVPRGGLKGERERNVPKTRERKRGNRDANSDRAKGKGKVVAEEMRTSDSVTEADGKLNDNQTDSKNNFAQPSTEEKKAKRKRRNLNMKMKADIRGASDSKSGRKRKTSENSQGRNQRNQNNGFGKGRRDIHGNNGSNRNIEFATYRNQYATRDAGPVRYEAHSYNTISGSKRPYADMEPHAGFLEPRKQSRAHSGQYEPPISMHYSPHSRTLYQPRELGIYHQNRAIYEKNPVEMRYADHGHGTHVQPHAGYFQSSIRNSSHDLRGGTTGRGGRHLHGIIPSAYGESRSSYPQHHSRAGYEAGSSGSDYYQSSRLYRPERGSYR